MKKLFNVSVGLLLLAGGALALWFGLTLAVWLTAQLIRGVQSP